MYTYKLLLEPLIQVLLCVPESGRNVTLTVYYDTSFEVLICVERPNYFKNMFHAGPSSYVGKPFLQLMCVELER